MLMSSPPEICSVDRDEPASSMGRCRRTKLCRHHVTEEPLRIRVSSQPPGDHSYQHCRGQNQIKCIRGRGTSTASRPKNSTGSNRADGWRSAATHDDIRVGYLDSRSVRDCCGLHSGATRVESATALTGG